MFRVDARRPATFCDGLTRRDFLHAGALAPLGLGLSSLDARGAGRGRDVNCIMLFLVGGPVAARHLGHEARRPRRDPRPLPADRDERARASRISEIFPRMATRSWTRSPWCGRSTTTATDAVHDTGHQMMQTGRLFTGGIEHPHVGCVLSKLKGPRKGDAPPHVLLPRPIGNDGRGDAARAEPRGISARRSTRSS